MIDSCCLLTIAVGSTLKMAIKVSRKKEILLFLFSVVHVIAQVSTNLKCPDGWSQNANSCYLYQTVPKTYQEALSSCESYGGSLLSIKDKAENDFISNFISTRNLQDIKIWIGLSVDKNRAQRNFEWSDGTPFLFTNWKSPEPNNMGGNEDCVEINHGWNDNNCGNKFHYICKLKSAIITANPSLKCPDGWSQNADSCYLYQSIQKTYQEALLSCESYGGSLLSIKDKAENDFISKFISTRNLQDIKIWMGLTVDKNRAQRNFEWSDGTPFLFTNWKSPEPNNMGGNEDCVEINDGWNDNNCGKQFHYICELKSARSASLNVFASNTNLREGDSLAITTEVTYSSFEEITMITVLSSQNNFMSKAKYFVDIVEDLKDLFGNRVSGRISYTGYILNIVNLRTSDSMTLTVIITFTNKFTFATADYKQSLTINVKVMSLNCQKSTSPTSQVVESNCIKCYTMETIYAGADLTTTYLGCIKDNSLCGTQCSSFRSETGKCSVTCCDTDNCNAKKSSGNLTEGTRLWKIVAAILFVLLYQTFEFI